MTIGQKLELAKGYIGMGAKHLNNGVRGLGYALVFGAVLTGTDPAAASHRPSDCTQVNGWERAAGHFRVDGYRIQTGHEYKGWLLAYIDLLTDTEVTPETRDGQRIAPLIHLADAADHDLERRLVGLTEKVRAKLLRGLDKFTPYCDISLLDVVFAWTKETNILARTGFLVRLD